MNLHLASIHVYPVKSLGGFAVPEARLTDRGLEHDRRWMLVDAHGRFLTQREVPEMALLRCAPAAQGFRITDIRNGDRIELPWSLEEGTPHTTRIWDDPVVTRDATHERNGWFRERLPRVDRLVYMPESTHRAVDPKYAEGLTSLSDGYPYLILSQASLDDLNDRMPKALPMDRFRPNLVIAGGEAFQEDVWRHVAIGDCRFELVKPCARCVIPTTDQDTAQRSAEPLRTLNNYRRQGDRILFGMNAMGKAGTVVRVGDLVQPLP
ncbi:MAG TPA: MOSC N-terminal beta barrel domain-containing protein [Flavobacteriales bacterium]